MFSYGMVLYELLSGRRPALGHHQLQIAKKLSKGVRPVLGSPQEVQFCCLHSLLTECWDTKPEKVRLPACLGNGFFPTQSFKLMVIELKDSPIHKYIHTLAGNFSAEYQPSCSSLTYKHIFILTEQPMGAI